MKFWFGEDLNALFSDSYEPNWKFWSGNGNYS